MELSVIIYQWIVHYEVTGGSAACKTKQHSL